jgi:BlaI family transcriptional regulator, penicillinase repressor
MLDSHERRVTERGNMPFRNRTSLPTSAEMRILSAVWQMGSATVDEIVNWFPEGERPNYKTTQAFLRIMENKGFVRHTARGRVFVFEPTVKKDVVDQRSVEALLAQNFGGSATGLFVNLLESDAVPAADIAALERMIREYKKRKKMVAGEA